MPFAELGVYLSISLCSCDPNSEVPSFNPNKFVKSRRTFEGSSHFIDSMCSKLQFQVSFWVFTSKEIEVSHSQLSDSNKMYFTIPLDISKLM